MLLSSVKTLLIGYIFELVFTARACDIIVTCTRPIFKAINKERFAGSTAYSENRVRKCLEKNSRRSGNYCISEKHSSTKNF